MSALTDWTKAELYPTLFNSGLDQALPELQLLAIVTGKQIGRAHV